MLLEILDLINEETLNYIVLAFNIFLLIVLTTSLVFVRDSRKRWNKVSDYLGDLTKTVDSVRYGDLTKKINSLDIIDSSDLTESLNRMIETLKDRELMINEFQKDLLKQNRILEQTVNSLSDGLLIVDEKGEIYRANSVITDWFETSGKELYGRTLFEYIELVKQCTVKDLHNNEIIIPAKRSSNFIMSSVELHLDDKKNAT